MKPIKKVPVRLSGKATSITLGGMLLPVNAFLASEVQVRNFITEGITVDMMDANFGGAGTKLTLENLADTFAAATLYVLCEESKSLSYKTMPVVFNIVDDKGVQAPADKTKVTVTLTPAEVATYADGVITMLKEGAVTLAATYKAGKVEAKREMKLVVKPAIVVAFSEDKEEIQIAHDGSKDMYYKVTGDIPEGELEMTNSAPEFATAVLDTAAKVVKVKAVKAGKTDITLKMKGLEAVTDKFSVTVLAEPPKVYQVNGISYVSMANSNLKDEETNVETTGLIRVSVTPDLFNDPEKLGEVTLASTNEAVIKVVKGAVTKAGSDKLEIALTATLVAKGDYQLTLKGATIKGGTLTSAKQFVTNNAE